MSYQLSACYWALPAAPGTKVNSIVTLPRHVSPSLLSGALELYCTFLLQRREKKKKKRERREREVETAER